MSRYRATVRVHRDPNLDRTDVLTDDLAEAAGLARRWIYEPGPHRDVEVLDLETGLPVDWSVA